MSAKKNLFASVSVLALSLGLAQNMHAAPCGSGSGVTISVTCTGPFTWTGGALNLTSTGLIELGATGVGVGMGVVTGTLTNDGTVSGTAAGLVNSLGGIDSILNRGRIYVEGDTGLANSGTISQLINSGEIAAINTGLLNAGTIGSITNSGRISGSMGILDVSGTILTFDNASGGTINGGTTAVVNAGGSIGSLTNSGLISGGAMGIMIDSGTISTIINASGGTISGSTATGVYNAGIYSYSGTIGTLTNGGVINGSISGFAQYQSRIDALNNDGGGTISGDSYGVLNSDSTIGTFTNAGGGLINGGQRGISNGGLIDSLDNSGVIEATGALATCGVCNSSGIINVFTNTGTITSAGGYGISSTFSTIGTLNNAGSISGQLDGVFIDGGILLVFTNAITGTIAGVTNGFHSDSPLQSDWSNAGRIMATGSTSAAGVFFEGSGSIGTVTNTGYISGTETGLRNERAITAFNNSGEARGGHTGLFNQGDIDTITNSGAILADGQAVNLSGGTVGTFTNTSSGLLFGSSAGGEGLLVQYSSLVLLENYGTIKGDFVGVDDYGTIGTIINAGLVTAIGGNGMTAVGVLVSAPLDVLTNSGTISAGSASVSVGIYATDTITALNNSGLIATDDPAGIAIWNLGTIGALGNSGTISGGGYAIRNEGALGTITNSGEIAGNIFSSSTSNLTILGGRSDEYGLLTAGTVTNTASNVVFASGYMVVEDAFDVGSYTVVNTGATLSTNSVISITGNYSQSAGMLSVGSVGELVVSGTAQVSGGIILASLPNTGTYVAGQSRTLISAASGSSYSGADVSVALTGLWLDVNKASTDSLVVRYLNSYIGGSVGTFTNSGTVSGSYMGLFVASGGNIGTLLNTGSLGGSVAAMYNAGHIDTLDNRGAISDGSGLFNTGSIGALSNSGLIDGDIGLNNTGTIGTIANSGTISGPDYAIYNTGTLGVVANSGLIAGNILSTSTANLTITGGSGSVFGTLSGGTITNTASDVVFASGNLLLQNAIDVGTHQVTNSDATIALPSNIAVTGKFSQTAGTIALGTSGQLAVSGTATMTGGSVDATLLSTANYIAGQSRTLVSAAADSSYGGLTVNASLTGLDVAASTSSTKDLVLTYRNTYVGGTLASLTNTGTTGSVYGLYIASSGNLAAFNNSGTLSGSSYAIYSAGTLGPIVNSGTISGSVRSVTALSISGGTAKGIWSGGTITAPNVTFTSGNILLRDNIVTTGTVTNSGAALEVESARTITGNYSQTSGSLVIDVASASSYGSLVVSGGATVSNTVVQLSGSGLSYGQAYTIIDANSASNYTGVTVDAGTFFSMISVLNNDLIVRLGLPLTDIGNDVGGDAEVTGSVLNGLQGNTSFGPVVTALAGVSTVAQGNALKQAAPAQVGNGVLLLQRAALITDMVDDAIGRRSGLLHNKQHGIILWADAMGGSARRNADGAAERTDISAWGVAMGADAAVGNDAMLGGAVSWATGRNTGASVLSGNSNKVNAIALTAYGAWSNGVLMVDGQAALGLNNYVQRRRIDVTGQTAEAHYDGRTYEVLANAGYDVPLGSFKLTPGVSLKWLRVAADGYSEEGAGVLNLTVGDTAIDQLRSRIGARLSRSFEMSVGWLRPDFSIAWQHDLIADAVTTDAVLSGVAFSTSAARPGSDGIALGTGLSLFSAGGTAVQVSYDGEFRRGYASHAGVMKFSISF